MPNALEGLKTFEDATNGVDEDACPKAFLVSKQTLKIAVETLFVFGGGWMACNRTGD